jgi:tetratricopeptide (TPR) repeat protein
MRFPVVFLLCCSLSALAIAEDKPLPKKGEKGVVPAKEDDWTGKKVIAKKPSRDIRFGNWVEGKQVEYSSKSLQYHKVCEDRDGFLLVWDSNREGWVRKDDFFLLDDALKFWSGEVERDAKNSYALQMRGIARLEKEDYDGAEADLTECIRRNPADELAYSNRARLFHRKNDHDRAIADLTQAIRLDPNVRDYYFHRGGSWNDKKELDKAIADMTEVIRIAPDKDIYVIRGGILLNNREYDKAIADFTESIRLDPSSGLAFATRAMAYYLKQDRDTAKALADLEESIRLNKTSNPGNNLSLFNFRAVIWLMEKKHEKALADLDEAIRLEPRFTEAYSTRGSVWHELKQYEKAIADFDNALKLDPKNTVHLFKKAVSHEKLNQWSEACVAYNDAVAVAPDAASYSSAAWFYATCPKDIFRDGKKAFEYARKAVEADATNPHTLLSLAAAYAESGAFDYAVTVQTKYVEKLKSAKKPDADELKKAEAILETYKSKKPYRDVNE